MHEMSMLKRKTPVIFLDTLYHFEETLQHVALKLVFFNSISLFFLRFIDIVYFYFSKQRYNLNFKSLVVWCSNSRRVWRFIWWKRNVENVRKTKLQPFFVVFFFKKKTIFSLVMQKDIILWWKLSQWNVHLMNLSILDQCNFDVVCIFLKKIKMLIFFLYLGKTTWSSNYFYY